MQKERSPKQYPMNGPTREMQLLRLKSRPKRVERNAMRVYAQGLRKNNGRPETIAAYEL